MIVPPMNGNARVMLSQADAEVRQIGPLHSGGCRPVEMKSEMNQRLSSLSAFRIMFSVDR